MYICRYNNPEVDRTWGIQTCNEVLSKIIFRRAVDLSSQRMLFKVTLAFKAVQVHSDCTTSWILRATKHVGSLPYKEPHPPIASCQLSLSLVFLIWSAIVSYSLLEPYTHATQYPRPDQRDQSRRQLILSFSMLFLASGWCLASMASFASGVMDLVSGSEFWVGRRQGTIPFCVPGSISSSF